MKSLKKILSIFCAVSVAVQTFVAFSSIASASTETPTIKVEILDSTGNKITDASTLKVDDTITVKYSYEGFNRLNYNDDEGNGGTMTVLQFEGVIPGLTSSNDTGYFKKAGGVTSLLPSSISVTGTPNYLVSADGDALFTTSVVYAGEGLGNPSTPSGELYSVKIKVKKEITEDLTFGFTDYDAYYYVTQTVDWAGDPSTAVKYNDITFESATLKAPVVEPEEPQITINNKYVFNFTADAGQEVMVKLTRANGIESDLTYSLPELVKGEASIFGLLKVTDKTVVSGDKFDISVVDANRNPVREITTITVE